VWRWRDLMSVSSSWRIIVTNNNGRKIIIIMTYYYKSNGTYPVAAWLNVEA
jgi:hypothetical protein